MLTKSLLLLLFLLLYYANWKLLSGKGTTDLKLTLVVAVVVVSSPVLTFRSSFGVTKRYCSLCTLYILAYQERVTVGNSDPCYCCVCVTFFKLWLTPLYVGSRKVINKQRNNDNTHPKQKIFKEKVLIFLTVLLSQKLLTIINTGVFNVHWYYTIS